MRVLRGIKYHSDHLDANIISFKSYTLDTLDLKSSYRYTDIARNSEEERGH